MIVTEAHILSGLIIKALGEKSTDSRVTLGGLVQQFPAKPVYPPPAGGFAAWEGTVGVSGNDSVTINLMTGTAVASSGVPDLSGLRGVDWEGLAVTSRPILRAIMIQNLSDKTVYLSGPISLPTIIRPFSTFHLAAGAGYVLANGPLNVLVESSEAVKKPVKFTVLLEATN